MDTTICLYSSKPCINQRSTKPDGELHRFCAFHREKANEAQKRWHSRRKMKAHSTARRKPTAVKTTRKGSESVARTKHQHTLLSATVCPQWPAIWTEPTPQANGINDQELDILREFIAEVDDLTASADNAHDDSYIEERRLQASCLESYRVWTGTCA